MVVAVVLALVAVATSTRSVPLWRLSTFSYQANVLAAAYYLWTLAWPRADTRVGVRGAVVLYVLIAGVVWNLFLTGHSGERLCARGRRARAGLHIADNQPRRSDRQVARHAHGGATCARWRADLRLPGYSVVTN
jgi:hypothetical protein